MPKRTMRALELRSGDDALGASRHVPSPHSTEANTDLRAGHYWVFPVAHAGGLCIVKISTRSHTISICDGDQWVGRRPTLRFPLAAATAARLRTTTDRHSVLQIAEASTAGVTLTLVANAADMSAAQMPHVLRASLSLGSGADAIAFLVNRHFF